MDTPVRAFVFDVGNTLWFEARAPDMREIERMEAERVRPLLDAWGVRLGEDLAPIIGEIWRAYDQAWRIEMDRGRYREPSLPFLIRGAMATRGIELSDEQARAWWKAAWIGAGHFGLQLYPDALDVLDAIRRAGLKIGANTNRPCTSEMFLRDAEAFGYARYLDAAVCSGDTGYLKPHPSTFELILERLGLRPQEAVMVGDTLAADIEAAKALGMRTIWKLNGRHDLPESPHADYAVHDLNEILTLPLFAHATPVVVRAESMWPHEDDNEDRY